MYIDNILFLCLFLLLIRRRPQRSTRTYTLFPYTTLFRSLRSTCGSVIRYAIATGRAQRDITVDLQGALIAPRVKHYASIIEPAKVGALLRAIEEYEGQPTVGIALRMAPHVFVRPGELRSAEWAEDRKSTRLNSSH